MEPNSQSTRRGRIRWLWVFAVVAVFAVAAVTRWLTKPLPPPVVSLSLAGFKMTPTNAHAVIALTNQGPTKLYFAVRNWRAEFETPSGMITNWAFPHGSIAAPYTQHEGRTFAIGIPDTTVRWRVVAGYEWFERRKPRVDILEWLVDHWHFDRGPTTELLERALSKMLGRLPEEFDLYDFVATPWLTNLPPAASLSD